MLRGETLIITVMALYFEIVVFDIGVRQGGVLVGVVYVEGLATACIACAVFSDE